MKSCFSFNWIRTLGIISCWMFLCVCYTNAQHEEFRTIAENVDAIIISQKTQSYEMINQLYHIAQNNPDSLKLIPQCLYRESEWDFAQGVQNDTLVTTIKNFLSYTDETSVSDRALLYYSLSMNYTAQGNYSDAFTSSLQALQLFENLNDSLFISKTFSLLGRICGHVRQFTMAYHYYEQALEFTKISQSDRYHAYTNLYRTYALEEKYEQCKDSLTRFIEQIKNYGDTALLVISYINIAVCYSFSNDYETAFSYCVTAQDLMKNIDNDKFKMVLYQNFAFYYFHHENFSQALTYLHDAAEIGEQNHILPYLSSTYYNLSHIYKTLGNIDSAYFYLEKYQDLVGRRDEEGKAIAAYHDYISAYIEASDNKLIIAQQKIELKNKIFIIVVMIAVGVIFLVGSFLIVARQQKRLKETENKELTNQLQYEKHIQQLQEEKHLDDIDSKIREITSYSIQLSDKNNLLKQISGLSKQLSKGGDVEEINKKINEIVQSNLNTEHEWESFRLYFDKVHPRFFDKLKSLCSTLTENNLRMCAYFRIGMTQKQVAHILNISHESVMTNRHRLKKKFGLTENDSLDDFLRNV